MNCANASAVLVLLASLTEALAVDLRCYCNLASCVATAYMCKSRAGCFQELPASDAAPFFARAGCLELWPDEEEFQCADLQTVRPPRASSPPPLPRAARTVERAPAALRCCLEDMCNYLTPLVEQPQLSVSIVADDDGGAAGRRRRRPRARLASAYWFRVAVVVVPVVGIAVLAVLMLLACAMLNPRRCPVDDDRLLEIGDRASSPFSPQRTAVVYSENKRTSSALLVN